MKAQEIILSKSTEVSVLTIGPGQQLYDSFGHNAFRVKDPTQNIDIVYNYGTYDFDTPNFYLKFAQGKLMYQLTFNNYTPFYKYYVRQNRWIKEQILNLTYSEKQAMFDFLQNNAKPENKDYLYDFLFDNCATKIRDVMVTVLGDKLVYTDDYITEEYTFRQLIQKNVYWNSWGSLGMDVAIGAIVDRHASAWQYQFLPQYIFEGAANATLTRDSSKQDLVKKDNFIFKNTENKSSANFLLNPLFIFGLLGLFILFITYRDFKNETRSRYLDGAIFLVTGIIGALLLLLWVATEHSTTANNYNLLWAFPLSLFFIFEISKKNPKKWMRKYVFFQILLLALLCLHWFTEVQIFAYGLIPLLVALVVRYVYLLKFLKK
ncbi:MAG: DUF4105 domain-containing protein [Bacteroidetes bacterium]|nr:DUF4105 domain-containing protein [Bacteroidota bacterium]